jgi:hypothetical protein
MAVSDDIRLEEYVAQGKASNFAQHQVTKLARSQA